MLAKTLALSFLFIEVWSTPQWKVGEYLRGDAESAITFSQAENGDLKFAIDAYGANGHSCSADGTLKVGATEAKPQSDHPDEKCVITFSGGGDSVTIDTNEECHAFCGVRASMGGIYKFPPRFCTRAAISDRHKEFTGLYQKKNYEAARKKLEKLVSDCKGFISQFREYDIQNDLAVTYHHLKDDARCLAVLEPLRHWADMSDEQIKEDVVTPVEIEALTKIAKAARTNLRLCGNKAGKK